MSDLLMCVKTRVWSDLFARNLPGGNDDPVQNPSKSLILLVAGAGFEPATFRL